ncbi:MAG: 3-methyl-2-oxobutanoate hydroxymethyltransferase [Candidatus Limnocylindrales bacterium]
MKRKLTMRDQLASKDQRQLVMTNASDYNTARAAEAAGIDIIAATVAYVSDAEAIRCAMLARDHGADLIYSSGNTPARLGAVAELGIPVAGHVGLVPIRATWVGGLRAVGKTIDGAVEVYRQTLAFQAIGAVAVEMECVPAAIAAEISRRTSLLVISFGSGPGCDGQFLYRSDLLGTLSRPRRAVRGTVPASCAAVHGPARGCRQRLRGLRGRRPDRRVSRARQLGSRLRRRGPGIRGRHRIDPRRVTGQLERWRTCLRPASGS